MHTTSRHNTGPRKCLVDRGANEIIFGGEDVRVISLSDKTLDVTVLGGHEMEDLRIGSVGGVVPTQKGEIVLALFDQCAYRLTGKSIISCVSRLMITVTMLMIGTLTMEEAMYYDP